MRNLPLFSGWLAIPLLQVLFTSQLTSQSPDTTVFCTGLSNAELPTNSQVFVGEEHADATMCSVHIWYTRKISEPCGTTVTYDVKLYLYSTGAAIQLVAPASVLINDDEAILTIDTRNSSLASTHPITRRGVPFTSGYCPANPDGEDFHLLVWTVVNECNVTSTFEQLIEVHDCDKPVVSCVGLSSVTVPSSGEITIWAKDFVSVVVDDCTSYEDLLYSFSENEYEPSRRYDCHSIECDGPSFLLEIWIADAGRDINCSGNVDPLGIEWSERHKDYCQTFFVMQDYSSPCNCQSDTLRRITTPGDKGIEDVRVDFVSNGSSISHVFTDAEGYYDDHFINPLLTTHVVPSKDDDPKRGVSTLDLVKLYRHLLGIQLLDSPFELFAADVNNSWSVSALDLVEIRKLILGIIPGFHKSWRFIHKSFVFTNPADPWQIYENYPNIDPQVAYYNPLEPFDGRFTGVKLGDINGTVNAGIGHPVTERNGQASLHLTIKDQFVRRGDLVRVPVYGDLKDLLGFQLTLETPGLRYAGISSTELNITSECIGVHDGAITLSYAAIEPLKALPSDFVLSLDWVAEAHGRLSEMLALSSAITEAEAYRLITSNEDEILVQNIQLHTIPDSEYQFTVFQNSPNPFTERTELSFVLPESMTVSLEFYNIYGQIVSSHSGEFTKGLNKVTKHWTELGPPGIYLCKLRAGAFSEVQAMLRIGD